MPCFKPVKAFYGNALPSGKRQIVFSSGQAQSCLGLVLRCNECVGCRLEKARQWAMRCTDEAALYSRNCFITLTYSDKFLPLNRSLDKRVFQLFMKRLRKFVGGEMIRYFACGEYGPLHGRPHYHALLFNLDFPDRVYLKTTPAGEKIYKSASLAAVWSQGGESLGYSSVGDVSFGSAAYVARYNIKKLGSVVSKNHYVHPSTGEFLEPEFVLMSRGSFKRGTGGIGRGWFDKYHSDVYPHDCRVIKGIDTKPARFYDSQYEKLDPVSFARVKLKRLVSASAMVDDNTEERLAVKERVKLAQVSILSTSKEI